MGLLENQQNFAVDAVIDFIAFYVFMYSVSIKY